MELKVSKTVRPAQNAKEFLYDLVLPILAYLLSL